MDEKEIELLWYFIDRIVARPTETSIVGIKAFTRSEHFFADHFHGYPVVPGVLQVEMIATTAGKCIKMLQPDTLPMLAKVSSAKFYHSVRPGDQCKIHAEVIKIRKRYVEAKGQITVEGKKVASAEVMFTLQPADIADPNWKDPIIKEWEDKLAAEKASFAKKTSKIPEPEKSAVKRADRNADKSVET